jgi:hypothetical protein
MSVPEEKPNLFEKLRASQEEKRSVNEGNKTPISDDRSKESQERFDKIYVSSHEVCKRLDVSRTALKYAMNREDLPLPIYVGKQSQMLWERKGVEYYLLMWEQKLLNRRPSSH